MSYIRDPIYMWMNINGNVLCAECGTKVVGHSDEDAYRHMIWHSVKFEAERKYLEAKTVRLHTVIHMINDVIDKRGCLSREDYAEIVRKISDWEEDARRTV